ncbi:MAG: phage/plasmid primase, P4 family [Alphaproteobacteria bacterium]|nr:phage/plasmid primase, P4 family [Alphaproteobacteria bacterium]
MDGFLQALEPLTSRVRTDISAVKRNGKVSWTKDPLTKDRLLDHLNNGHARGVCPIKEGEDTTQVALFDLDSHKGETDWDSMAQVAKILTNELKKHGINPIPWRSSGGSGMHILMIWDTPQDAYSVRALLNITLENIGYKNGTKGVSNKQIEIFPKQDSVRVGGCGNQFILPLAGKSVPLNPVNFEPLDKNAALLLSWPVSIPVTTLERPKAAERIKTSHTDLESLEIYLQYISPLEGYDTWLKVGMALHYETNGSEQGLELWDTWSNQERADYPGYDALKYKWESFKHCSVRPTTVGTLIFLARQSGWENGKPILMPADHTGIAKQIIDADFRSEDGDINLLRTQGQWFHHEGKCYKEASEETIRATVRHYLDGALKVNKDGDLIPFHPTMAQINAVTDALKSSSLIEGLSPPTWIGEHDKQAVDFISMDNGIFHVPSRTLAKHTPDYFTLNTLPYPYKESGEPKEFLKFLDSVWPDDQESINTLQEMFGYLLVANVSLHKMFLLKGPKRSGKGTIGRLLKMLLGASNVCGPSLKSFSKDFGLQPCIGKLAAIVPDARIGRQSDKQAIVENLLMISGGDNISVPRKHIEDWDGQLPTRIVVLTNETPQLGDASGALASRFIVLEMKVSFFGREDLNLEDRLMSELPQIFNWALDGLKRLNARGRFIQPQSAMDTVCELESLNSPLIDFVNTHCVLGVEHHVPKYQLFNVAYKLWCTEQGISFPKVLGNFSKDLLAAFPQIGISRLGSGSNREHVFTGIKVKEDAFGMQTPKPHEISQASQGLHSQSTQ